MSRRKRKQPPPSARPADTPSEEEVRAMEELARREAARAKKLRELNDAQTGAVRREQERLRKRKQAKQARRRNR